MFLSESIKGLEFINSRLQSVLRNERLLDDVLIETFEFVSQRDDEFISPGFIIKACLGDPACNTMSGEKIMEIADAGPFIVNDSNLSQVTGFYRLAKGMEHLFYLLMILSLDASTLQNPLPQKADVYEQMLSDVVLTCSSGWEGAEEYLIYGNL